MKISVVCSVFLLCRNLEPSSRSTTYVIGDLTACSVESDPLFSPDVIPPISLGFFCNALMLFRLMQVDRILNSRAVQCVINSGRLCLCR
jgi:hypothetical protein